MEFKQNDLDDLISDRKTTHLGSDAISNIQEVEWAFSVINNFDFSKMSEDQDQNLEKALEYIKNYLIFIKKSKNADDFQYETIITPLIKLFLQQKIQSLNLNFLQLFHHITAMLSDSKISEYFSIKDLSDILMNFISSRTQYSNISSRVLSHLIISKTITDFYNMDDFLRIAPLITDLSDRAYYLFTLSQIGIPEELFFDFVKLSLDTFMIDNLEIVTYCCESISNCVNDNFPDLPQDAAFLNILNELFYPFLNRIQPEILLLLTNKETVIEVIELFKCLLYNLICEPFFANDSFIQTLFQASINTLPSYSAASNIKDDFFFEVIFPFVTDIYFRFKINVSQELFSTVVSIAQNGTFKVRKSAFLFIANNIDQIIDDSPEFFYDFTFYELLIEIVLSGTNEAMLQLLECICKLLSARQCRLIDFLNDEKQAQLYEEFMIELDKIADEMEDDDIDKIIYEIKDLIQKSKPRSYEHEYF